MIIITKNEEEGAVATIYIGLKYSVWTASLKKQPLVSEIIAHFQMKDEQKQRQQQQNLCTNTQKKEYNKPQN